MSDQVKTSEFKFDFLGNILETLRFRGSIFFRSDLAAPWGFALEEMGVPRFHIVLKGDCMIGVGDYDSIRAKAMDIVMVPHGNMHWIADQAGRQLVPSERAASVCELGAASFKQGHCTDRIICGLVHFNEALKHPLLQSLPPVLHFSAIEETDSIWTTVELIDKEMSNELQSVHIINRLAEILFLQLLKKYINDSNMFTGFFLAMNDPKVYQVLELIHQSPHFSWALSLLGEASGMSTATLNRRFKRSVGVSPMKYLAVWRMIRAHHFLNYSNFSLDKIAELVGFSSARALSKAFVQHYGMTPNSVRKNKTSTVFTD